MEGDDLRRVHQDLCTTSTVRCDFYGATLAGEAAERLHSCEALIDTYAKRVFDAHDENR